MSTMVGPGTLTWCTLEHYNVASSVLGHLQMPTLAVRQQERKHRVRDMSAAKCLNRWLGSCLSTSSSGLLCFAPPAVCHGSRRSKLQWHW